MEAIYIITIFTIGFIIVQRLICFAAVFHC